MLHLFIMRHAKSSWAIPGQIDFERGLNERGQTDLPYLSEYIDKNNIAPAVVLCSPAARTRATFKGIQTALPEHELRLVEELYHGATEDYLEFINRINTPSDVLVIGHNPSCELLVNTLIYGGDLKAIDALGWKYPTGAIAKISFEVDDWGKIRPKTGYLSSFVAPRLLREANS